MIEVKKYCSLLLLLVLSFNCASNKFKLEDSPVIQVEKAYYSNWYSGIREGGTGLNLHIEVSSNDSKKKLVGIYFRSKYTRLKFNEPNIYTGFIKISDGEKINLDTSLLENKQSKVENNKKQEEIPFPFTLASNEAVLMCLVNDKKKYFKIQVEEKKTSGIPQ